MIKPWQAQCVSAAEPWGTLMPVKSEFSININMFGWRLEEIRQRSHRYKRVSTGFIAKDEAYYEAGDAMWRLYKHFWAVFPPLKESLGENLMGDVTVWVEPRHINPFQWSGNLPTSIYYHIRQVIFFNQRVDNMLLLRYSQILLLFVNPGNHPTSRGKRIACQ